MLWPVEIESDRPQQTRRGTGQDVECLTYPREWEDCADRWMAPYLAKAAAERGECTPRHPRGDGRRTPVGRWSDGWAWCLDSPSLTKVSVESWRGVQLWTQLGRWMLKHAKHRLHSSSSPQAARRKAGTAQTDGGRSDGMMLCHTTCVTLGRVETAGAKIHTTDYVKTDQAGGPCLAERGDSADRRTAYHWS